MSYVFFGTLPQVPFGSHLNHSHDYGHEHIFEENKMENIISFSVSRQYNSI